MRDYSIYWHLNYMKKSKKALKISCDYQFKKFVENRRYYMIISLIDVSYFSICITLQYSIERLEQGNFI
jgi:hypothetical protein